MKKRIIDMIIQIIPVMIGVYLGFSVSDWGDSRKSQAQSQQLIKSIKLEINQNKEGILSVLDYHKMLRDSSRYYLDNPIGTTPSYFKGTRTKSLLTSAYDTGIQTGIINSIDLNKIQWLNKLYAMQKSYDEIRRMQLQGVINMDLSESPQNIKKNVTYLARTMTDIVLFEEDLIAMFDVMNNKILK